MPGLQNAWQAWSSIHGDRSMPMLKKAFGQYEYTEDPAFRQDMQMFQSNPNQATASMIINRWGDHMGVEDYQELGQRINYLEGTPQATKQQMLEDEASILSEKASTYPQYRDAQVRQALGQADMAETKADWLPKQYELQYDRNQLARDMSALDLAFQEQTQPASIEAEIAKANSQAAQGNYNTGLYNNLDPNQMAEYKMTQAGEQARQAEQQTAMNEEKLYQLEQQNSVLNQQLQNDLTIQEQNILSNKINNQINQLQLQKGRKLLPYEIEQAKNQVLTQEAQLRGINLQNQGRVYNNQLTENELWKSNQIKNIMQEMGKDELSIALGLAQPDSGTNNKSTINYWSKALGSNFGYAGQTQNGELVFEDTQGGRIAVNPQTGQTRDYTNQPVQNTLTMNPAESLIENPIIGNTLSSEQIETIRTNYDRQMPIEQAQEVINSYVNDPDLTNLIMTNAMGGPQNIDRRKNINYHSYNQEPEEKQTQSYSNMSTKQLINLFEEKNPNMSPQELAEYLKIYRESIEQNLGVDIGSVIGQLSMTGEDIGF